MPYLESDNAGKNVPSVWLGPEGSWRWPFDASYQQWTTGFLLLGPVAIVLGAALPVGLILFAAVWIFGGKLARRYAEAKTSLLRRAWFWRAAIGAAVLLSPWVTLSRLYLSMNVVLALLLTPFVCGVLVKRYGRWLTPMTPFRYWRRVFKHTITRPGLRRERQLAPSFVTEVGEVEEELDLADFADVTPLDPEPTDRPKKLSLTKEPMK